VTVTTTQNLNIGGQAVELNATNDGQVTYQYQSPSQNVTVSNNGTSIQQAPGSTSTSNSKKSESSRLYICPKWVIIFLVFMSIFSTQIHAQSLSWDSILSGIPPENVQFIEGLESQLCGASIPVIDAAVCGGRQAFLSVADITRICLQIVGEAPQPDSATADPASAFVFALGNTIACDQIANAMLSGPHDQAGRDLCSDFVPSSTCTTSVFTTEISTHGTTIVSTLSTLAVTSSGTTHKTAASSGTTTVSGTTGSKATASAAASAQVSGASTGSAPSGVAPSVTSSTTTKKATSTTSITTTVSAPLAGNLTSALLHRRNGIICNDYGL